MLNLENRFKTTFIGTFGFNIVNEKEAIKKIKEFVRITINNEYKFKESNVYSEMKNINKYLKENFEFDHDFELININDGFLAKYKKELVTIFSDKDVKEVKYNYKHFYFFNFRKIVSALDNLNRSRRGIKFYKAELLEKLDNNEILYERFLNLCDLNDKEQISLKYILLNNIKELKPMYTITNDMSYLRNTQEIRDLETEFPVIAEYFENNDKFTFEEIFKLTEKYTQNLTEEHRNEILFFLNIFLK